MRGSRSRRAAWSGLLLAWFVSVPASGRADDGRQGDEPPMPLVVPVSPRVLESIEAELVQAHGEGVRVRAERGLRQVASLWRAEDGDLRAFALEHFLADSADVSATFQHLEATFEQIDGHFLEISRALSQYTALELGPTQRVDDLLNAYDPSAHLTDDLFQDRIGFVTLLNFPLSPLEEKQAHAQEYSRRDWAERELTARFARRVPADVQQRITQAQADASTYIDSYNIWMHHLVDGSGARPFPKGLRLITHWNLRDEIKAQYAEAGGLERQRLITRVMDRIVTQSIPQAVIDNPRVDWNPVTNEVRSTPASELEPDAPAGNDLPVTSAPEDDVRYARLLATFQAERAADPFGAGSSTRIARGFEDLAVMSEERVRALLLAVLEAPASAEVAREIRGALGRDLEPHDIWFSGFRSAEVTSEDELDARCRKRYPNSAAFAADVPRILRDLGFAPERADWLAARIVVDPSRGAGHALQAARRGDLPHLRTRVEADGMNYKGYNIAVHELGHNVEQLCSLYDVDHTLLSGVPNTAFTEALAFVFQAKDRELMGFPPPSAEAERRRVLDDFWATREIAGVALLDVGVWHWMYDHPEATPSELREATLQMARELWNRHYAPFLGGPDCALLAIYSHMISYPLYLFNYPLGHLIAFQIEEQMHKAGRIGPEFERMARFGSVLPDTWMEHATGAPVSADPLLRATERALRGK